MENTGLFQQEQETRAKNHCTNLWPLLDTDAIFPERDEGFWQKLENRATEKHIRVQFHNPEHTIRDDLRKYLDVLEKRSATVMFARLHMPVRPESFIPIN